MSDIENKPEDDKIDEIEVVEAEKEPEIVKKEVSEPEEGIQELKMKLEQERNARLEAEKRARMAADSCSRYVGNSSFCC